jgi:hypothetical protein
MLRDYRPILIARKNMKREEKKRENVKENQKQRKDKRKMRRKIKDGRGGGGVRGSNIAARWENIIWTGEDAVFGPKLRSP